MFTTYVTEDAARRLRHGSTWISQEDIVSMEGVPPAGEPVLLCDERGQSLGFADFDLQSPLTLRRLGRAEEAPEGLLQRHLRLAGQRRGLVVDDPRYCRLANDDGDDLPGLVVDRYDAHFVVQTSSRAMDTRVQEVARSLVEVLGARSVLLRNDSGRRSLMGLPPARPHVLRGTPPRWARLMEMGARMTVDLTSGEGTGYFYDRRELRKMVAHLAEGARVLDVCCYVGGLFVHAGLNGARELVAVELDPDTAELARENAEANGLSSRTEVICADAFELLGGGRDAFDLVLVDPPDLDVHRTPSEEDPFVRLARLCIRRTRHGGRLVIAGHHPPLPQHGLDPWVELACQLEGRVAYRLGRPALPPDFPTVLGSGEEHLSALALELS